jgi:hypothetical protein
MNDKIEAKDIPTTNISTKNQHDITLFSIKAIKDSNDSKKNELSDLVNLAKELEKEKLESKTIVEKCNVRIEELKKELADEKSKLMNANNRLEYAVPLIIETKVQIQKKEKELELLKKSEIDLGYHLETLKKKLDHIDHLIQNRDLSTFKVEDVGIILNEIGLSEFEEKFKGEEISGASLKKMNENNLVKLGMNNIHDRKKLLHTIDLIQNHRILHPIPSINTISNWNAERVCEWLKEKGYKGNVEEFKGMNINGVFLLYLNEEDLEVILKITKMVDRMRLLDEIEKLKISQRNSMDQLTKVVQSKEGSKSNIIIPKAFYCPITMELMKDPVMATDGHVYERSAIEKWFRQHDTSPLTNWKIEDKKLIPWYPLKSAIDEYLSNPYAN